MPYRTPARLEEQPKWPSLPEPWWGDMKPVVQPGGTPGVPWGLYVLLIVVGVIVGVGDGWAIGVAASATLGVFSASCFLVAEAIAFASSRPTTSPKWWLAVQLAIVATFYGLCLAIGAIEFAIFLLAISAVSIVVPFAVVSAVEAVRRIAAR